MALTIARSTGGIASPLDAGAVTSGAANQVICDSGAVANGNAQPNACIIDVSTLQAGTVDTNRANIYINVGGTNAAGIISGGVTYGPLLSTANTTRQRFRLPVADGQHVYVVVGNTTPGVGSVYCATLSVTRCYDTWGT